MASFEIATTGHHNSTLQRKLVFSIRELEAASRNIVAGWLESLNGGTTRV